MAAFDFAAWKTAFEPMAWGMAFAAMVIGVGVMAVRDFLAYAVGR